MAKFITTKQITSELENLIKKADERLYIVSPYLKLSKDFRDLLTYRNTNRKDTKIIFGKQELNPEQMTFFQGLRFVYLFFSGSQMFCLSISFEMHWDKLRNSVC